MKIFVTGATGFMGGFLVERLVNEGHQVKVLKRKTSNLRYLDGLDVEFVHGDITEIESLKEATKDVEIVIHLASLIHPVNVPDSLYYDINVKGTENVFNTAYENNKDGLKQFIHCSTVAVYGKIEDENTPLPEDSPCVEQTTIYGVTKYEGELAIKPLAARYNIPLTIVRPSRVYGKRDRSFLPLCRMMKKGLFFNIGPGKTFMQPVYVADCIEGIMKTINNTKAFGGVYNLAGPEAMNKKEFLGILAENLGKKLPKFNVPIFVVKTAAIINELLYKPFKKDPFVSRKKLAFFLRSNKYDISSAKKDLNYDPQVSPPEGIKRMVEWYKEENII